ncbi:MAG TPA: lactate permease LctP family transporter [Bryobacteraceae bacterium]|nr:lactate permease LctP family transporter [Bryobacteraceae bacterium]
MSVLFAQFVQAGSLRMGSPLWQQNYAPLGGSLAASTLAAALPVFVLLYLLGVRRTRAWLASISALGAAALAALVVYRMPPVQVAAATAYGAAFGIFPIGWIVFTALLLYRVTVESGKFEILKDSIGGLTSDRRLQALLIAFAFGAFLEGAAGFGAPVAVAAAMLVGLGFSPFYAAAVCLLANTAPVAFGSIGIPVVTLAGVTGLPLAKLSAGVGRICAPVSLIVPTYLIVVMGGRKALRGVLGAAVVCGAAFAGTQFAVSNFIGPQLTDICSSLAAIGALVAWLLIAGRRDRDRTVRSRPWREVLMAWAPYGLLVVVMLIWGWEPARLALNRTNAVFAWPGLHKAVLRVPPVVSRATVYPALYTFNWLAASGTACLLAVLLSSALLRMSPRRLAGVAVATARQLALPLVTFAAVLGLAFLMNYSGATGTLGLAFARTGRLFPFFSALLGWLGVFLTGSDTSSNALFGNLQAITAARLGLSPVLMAAANSAGGVMGKMISLQSIAVACAAAGLGRDDEARLFRFTLRHSLILASLIGLITVIYAYVGGGV